MARNRKDTPVVLSRIYTRTGDNGTTRLGDMSQTTKTDPRLVAYADVDEANCAIGAAIALGGLDPAVAGLLTRIQNELFDVGADLCRPIAGDGTAGHGEQAAGHDSPGDAAASSGAGSEVGGTAGRRTGGGTELRISEDYITRLEAACDQYNEQLTTLRSFVLPGGTPGAALLHTARAVTRRAERSAWAALASHGDSVNRLTARYLNRLSDLLFILARHANAERGDVLWVPGGER